MIKYLGSKRALAPAILALMRGFDGVRTVVDLFAGTSRVGHALKAAGFRVLANDHNAYAATLARCYVAADRDLLAAPAEQLLRELQALPGRAGWFTETYCVKSRFFQPKNGAKVDAIRDAITRLALPPELEAVALVSLMEAADRVDSTTGVQMAYLKQWSRRAHNDLQLRLPELLPRAVHGKGEAHCRDALAAACHLAGDAAYVDPPYNQHSYLGNYHVWESLVRWDKPATFGVACKRVDCQQRQSVFNSRPRCASALRDVLRALRVDRVVVSYNDEGYVSRAEIEAMLAGLWHGDVDVTTIAHDHRRYVGARIGIHNPRGEKVGKIGRLRNTEYLYVAERRGASRPFAATLAAHGAAAGFVAADGAAD